MSARTYDFTSESVSEGHPDKVADRVSDAIVDLFLAEEPEARVAVETLTTTNRVVLAGEVRSHALADPDARRAALERTVRRVVREIGYEQDGFHHERLAVDVHVHEQAAEIAQGVDEGEGKPEGAGDQGIMFGFATDETESLMPAPIALAHGIVGALAAARHDGSRPELEPDAKSQVTLRYEDGRPVGCDGLVVSTQHREGLSQSDVRDLVTPYVERVMPEGWMPPEDAFYVNPTGSFVQGGPDGDAGLTGRKIIVDTYGGAAPHGGGAFSGKDPTKVDRSAAYACRYLAKNVVAAGLARRCLIQVSYAIGIADPLSVYVDLSGTGEVDEERLGRTLREVMDLTPKGIRTHLGLNRPIYERTAAYGHFGRTPDAEGGFSWERTDLVDALKGAF